MIISEVVKEGIVTETKGKRATVEVTCGKDSCSGCSISLFCNNRKDTISLKTQLGDGVNVGRGDRVIVIGRIKGWLTSWLLLAGLPIVAILGSVIAGFAMGMSDGVVGAMAIAVTAIYYICLWFFRKSLNRRVEWIIENNDRQPDQ